MISKDDARPLAGFLLDYQSIILRVYPTDVRYWPLLSGWNIKQGTFKYWHIYALLDSNFNNLCNMHGIGEIDESVIGFPTITRENIDAVRKNLERYLNVSSRDFLLLWPPDDNISSEFEIMLKRHEYAMGKSAMKIFLSHKSVDKDLVRKFKKTLSLLGFDPWVDEDAMPAGTILNRGILSGFKESCAAIFFITPSFSDEKYLATEIDYAIEEKNKKEEKFAIITLVFSNNWSNNNVPELLRRFVWKQPQSEIEAIQEIISALPIKVGPVHWK